MGGKVAGLLLLLLGNAFVAVLLAEGVGSVVIWAIAFVARKRSGETEGWKQAAVVHNATRRWLWLALLIGNSLGALCLWPAAQVAATIVWAAPVLMAAWGAKSWAKQPKNLTGALVGLALGSIFLYAL